MNATIPNSVEGKYLTFLLSQERYGIGILKVHEIIKVMNITLIPRSPRYVKGVINLRGRIIPIVDLRLKFNIEPIPYNERTCIIITTLEIGGRALSVGVVVDTVLEVVQFDDTAIEPAPDYGESTATKNVLGLGRTHDEHVVVLLDIEKVLADAGNLVNIKDTQAEAAAADH